MSRIFKALLVAVALVSCGPKEEVTSTDTTMATLDTAAVDTIATETDAPPPPSGPAEGGALGARLPAGGRPSRPPRPRKSIPVTAPTPEAPTPESRPMPESLPPDPVAPVEMKDFTKVPVFYGTNRLPDADDDRNLFGSERAPGGRMQYGIGWVSIPRSHEMGELEGPSIRTFTFREDPAKHIVLLENVPQSKDNFFARLAASVPARNKQAFLFIHGYNVAFADAARRAAQIKYDLGFEGPAILFSWPSHGTTELYAADENNAEASVPQLVSFLLDVRARSGADTIHLIAHSLGNRVLTRALERIDLDAAINPKPRFRTIVLAAPDVDADVFREQLAPRMRQLADAITLYGSDDDLAIVASKKVHDINRAGEGGDRLPIVDGIDSIDVTGLDASFLAHSYVGGVSVLGDIHQLICSRMTPGQRAGIQPRAPLAGWKLLKQQLTREVQPCGHR